ncbi:MAG: phage tail protein, partial [Salinisphaera sp.]|nr:phage tail protein [Salinisphaera sp.]
MPQVEGLAEVRDSAEKLARADKVRSTIARRAVNRTVSHARSYATKTIRQKIGLKAAVIRKSIKAYRARGQQNAGRIVVEKNPQPLIRFGARELKRGGVSVAVHRGQRKRIPAAFILEPKQGGRVVAIRRKKPGGGRVGRTRRPCLRPLSQHA